MLIQHERQWLKVKARFERPAPNWTESFDWFCTRVTFLLLAEVQFEKRLSDASSNLKINSEVKGKEPQLNYTLESRF